MGLFFFFLTNGTLCVFYSYVSFLQCGSFCPNNKSQSILHNFCIFSWYSNYFRVTFQTRTVTDMTNTATHHFISNLVSLILFRQKYFSKIYLNKSHRLIYMNIFAKLFKIPLIRSEVGVETSSILTLTFEVPIWFLRIKHRLIKIKTCAKLFKMPAIHSKVKESGQTEQSDSYKISLPFQ